MQKQELLSKLDFLKSKIEESKNNLLKSAISNKPPIPNKQNKSYAQPNTFGLQYNVANAAPTFKSSFTPPFASSIAPKLPIYGQPNTFGQHYNISPSFKSPFACPPIGISSIPSAAHKKSLKRSNESFPIQLSKRNRVLAAKNIVTEHNKTESRKQKRDMAVLQKQSMRSTCLFFNRYGKCRLGDKCNFQHDKAKIAICRKFLLGKCTDNNCLLDHHIDPNKMPDCKFFQQKGACNSNDCFYRHIKFNDSTERCQEFALGYCALGVECKLIHDYSDGDKSSKKNPSTTKTLKTNQYTSKSTKKKEVATSHSDSSITHTGNYSNDGDHDPNLASSDILLTIHEDSNENFDEEDDSSSELFISLKNSTWDDTFMSAAPGMKVSLSLNSRDNNSWNFTGTDADNELADAQPDEEKDSCDDQNLQQFLLSQSEALSKSAGSENLMSRYYDFITEQDRDGDNEDEDEEVREGENVVVSIPIGLVVNDKDRMNKIRQDILETYNFDKFSSKILGYVPNFILEEHYNTRMLHTKSNAHSNDCQASAGYSEVH